MLVQASPLPPRSLSFLPTPQRSVLLFVLFQKPGCLLPKQHLSLECGSCLLKWVNTQELLLLQLLWYYYQYMATMHFPALHWLWFGHVPISGPVTVACGKWCSISSSLAPPWVWSLGPGSVGSPVTAACWTPESHLEHWLGCASWRRVTGAGGSHGCHHGHGTVEGERKRHTLIPCKHHHSLRR